MILLPQVSPTNHQMLISAKLHHLSRLIGPIFSSYILGYNVWFQFYLLLPLNIFICGHDARLERESVREFKTECISSNLITLTNEANKTRNLKNIKNGKLLKISRIFCRLWISKFWQCFYILQKCLKHTKHKL